MRKYGQIYLRFINRPKRTEYDPGQVAWIPTPEAERYIAEGLAEETEPGAPAPKEDSGNNDLSVAEIEEIVAEQDSAEELAAMLTAEKDGKARKTAIKAIEGRIEELTENTNEE